MSKTESANERKDNLEHKARAIDLEKLEAFIYGRFYQEAFPEALNALNRLRRAVTFDGHGDSERPLMTLYTRLASALTAMLADPKFMISELGFHMMCREHEVMDAVFSASEFGGMDHLAPQFSTPRGERDPEKIRFSTSQDVVKFASCWTLGSDIDFDYTPVVTASDAARFLMMPWYFAMLAQQTVISPRAHDRRERLLGEWPLFDKTPLTPAAMAQASDAFMFCSYGTRRDKHDVKKLVSQSIRDMIPLPPGLPPRPERKKPLLLVSLEWSLSLHAMFRVYGPQIAQLREKFEVVGLQHHGERDLDGPMVALFDRVVKARPGNDLVALREVVEQVIAIAPDVIYFPSVGMVTSSTWMSALRLAPLQVQSYGHPATAGSTSIDFGITEEGTVGDESLHVERLCYTPAGTLQFVERTDQHFPPPAQPRTYKEDGTVVVGVPAMILKLSVPFLHTLRKIQERCAPRKVEYRFYPNLAWLPYYRAAKELKRWFPDGKTYPRFFYDEYLRQLAECDLILSTFPFGGTNSLVDAMLMGLPIVCKHGDEIHEGYDGFMIRKVGFGDLIADDLGDYETIATEMITDDALRARYASMLDREKVRAAFFAEPTGPAAGAFGRAMWHLWTNRERLKTPDAPRSTHWKEFT